MRGLLVKYKGIILYGVFGILTTLINWGVYNLTYNTLHIKNVPSTIIAWILAVVFAFITNKLWVFGSKKFDVSILKHEVTTFFAARIFTGVLDVGIMFVAVDCMHWNSSIWKLLSNILVIILNYVASKMFIFRNTTRKDSI